MSEPNRPDSISPNPNPTIRLNLPDGEQAGERIGRYKLLQQIGEGGVVYMAEQEEPVRRRVALKVINPAHHPGRRAAATFDPTEHTRRR